MNNPAVNNETIVKYLLGSLAGAEAERLDELSITDDEFAVALNAAEKDLVDAYVQGELTGATLENFRSYYLASPLRHGRIEFAQALEAQAERHHPAQSATAGEEFPGERPTRQARSGWFPGKGFFTTPRLAWQWGFAVAAISFLIAGSWLLSENVRLRRQISQTQPTPVGSGTRDQELQNELERQRQAVAKTEQELARVRDERKSLEDELKKEQDRERVDEQQQPSRQTEGLIVSFILAPQMRGIGQVPTVSVPAETEYVAMQLDMESNDHPAYRVSLLDPSNNQVLWRSGRIKPTGNRKALGVRFRAGLLKPQTYLLQVSGLPASGEPEVVGDYPFRVVR